MRPGAIWIPTSRKLRRYFVGVPAPDGAYGSRTISALHPWQGFTPRLAERLTGLAFRNQIEGDNWLRDLWTTFFPGDLHPGDRTEPDDVKKRPPENATGFRFDEALVAAMVLGWEDPAAKRKRAAVEAEYLAALTAGASEGELQRIAKFAKVVGRVPAEQALGPAWRRHVQGYETCYPMP